jgi:hypothetical protein
MWRITDDFWDDWTLLKDMFDRFERWYAQVGPGSWPDCDMLPLGHIGIRQVDGDGSDRLTRFIRDEQRTMMSLWSIFRSPLIMGGEMRDKDEWTLGLLTKPEVLAVNQGGARPRPIAIGGRGMRSRPAVAWASDGCEGSTYVALFNLGEDGLEVGATWEERGLSGRRSVRDLWAGEDLAVAEGRVSASLPPHGSVLLKLSTWLGLCPP